MSLIGVKMSPVETEINKFMRGLKKRNAYQVDFHQAVEEVVSSVMPWYLDHQKLVDAQILERLTEPDRIISFRVSWQKDNGEIRVNRGWRVQFCNAIGPYKGGLRFHPGVDENILKFLGFEQIFKNSLTGLPMGGAKGGSNFDPKGKSDNEVMQFCHSFMRELYPYIGEDIDVPAGDIGVGAREISALFGQYMSLAKRWAGVMTGKGATFGGSAVRTEATGYGCVYFCEDVLNQIDEEIEGKILSISGSGNVALYAAEKAIEKRAKVITMSDSGGFIYAKDGLDEEQLRYIIDLKENKRGRLNEVAEKYKGIQFHENKKPWVIETDIAMPCATQNEIVEEDAKSLIKNKLGLICEGANMPTTTEAAKMFKENKIVHVPGKASNAGGVAVSGLEQTQNALRLGWSRKKVDKELQKIMKNIFKECVAHGKEGDHVDYIKGANISAFKKVAETLYSYGVV
jgi:glutamate dehydrogenase (NADP+)